MAVESRIKQLKPTVYSVHKKLEDTWDIDATIQMVPNNEGTSRTFRDTEFVVKAR